MCFRALIEFISDPDAPQWVGYSLAATMFGVAFVQSMILHQYFHRCFLTGMHVRTAIISAVYRKVRDVFIIRHLILNAICP